MKGHLVLPDLGLAENISTFEGGENMVQFPVWLNARTKDWDKFPLFWIGGHVSTKINRPLLCVLLSLFQ